MTETTDQLRAALYYPYIHIRSEPWLKATLLCMPSVKRIVPDEYTPEDRPAIKAYTNIKGPNGGLLQSVPSYSHAAYEAQCELLKKLKDHENFIKTNYGRDEAPPRDTYWIHKAKFIEGLLQYLEANGLAWTSIDPTAVGHRTWYALHPTLGKAIMTTLGLSIAGDEHYDIVTANGSFHEALLATKQDQVFEALLRGHADGEPRTSPETRHELGQLVITLSGVRLNALLPHQIPELQSSPHFQTFQRLLRRAASTIDKDTDHREYKRQLKAEAEEIVTNWHETKQDVGKEIGEALFETAALGGDVVKNMLKGPEPAELAICGALGLWRVTTRVRAFLQRRKNTQHYLTDVLNSQHPVLKVMCPLGLPQTD